MIYELTAESAAGQRIDKYLSEQLADLSRSYLQKLLKDGGVEVNGKTVKSNYKLADKDQICLEVPEAVEPEIAAEPMDLDILYEDKDIILINKPKGMVVHPAAGHYTGTLVNGLMYHCKDELSGINGVMRPGIVHRIDMDTTGVLIVCKNDKAHNAIAEQLKVHSITRKYYAIVHGVIKEDDGTVNAPIGRHPVDRKKMSINEKNGKEAVTHYHVSWKPGGRIRSACIWQVSVIRFLEIRFMDRQRYRFPAFRVRPCMRGCWGLFILLRESTWSFAHRFRSILKSCCESWNRIKAGVYGFCKNYLKINKMHYCVPIHLKSFVL